MNGTYQQRICLRRFSILAFSRRGEAAPAAGGQLGEVCLPREIRMEAQTVRRHKQIDVWGGEGLPGCGLGQWRGSRPGMAFYWSCQIAICAVGTLRGKEPESLGHTKANPCLISVGMWEKTGLMAMEGFMGWSSCMLWLGVNTHLFQQEG